ncbi:hypothetical protein KBB05_04770 [Patescibacteria group bacterium]|nr:hypothetical protein [Patescibacteria group bacterium]
MSIHKNTNEKSTVKSAIRRRCMGKRLSVPFDGSAYLTLLHLITSSLRQGKI